MSIALLKKVKFLNNQNKYKSVIKILNEELLKKYNDPDLYAEKAKAYFKIKEIDLCKNAYKKALAIKPDSATANYWKGNVFYHTKKNKKAIKCFKQAINNNSKDFELYSRLGTIYNHLKMYDNSIEIYRTALDLFPDDPTLNNALGDTYRDSKDFVRAKLCYESSMTNDKKNAHPLNGLGDIAAADKDYSAAEIKYSQAIKINKKFMEAYYNRAIVFLNQEKYKEALSDFKSYEKIKNAKDKLSSDLKSTKIAVPSFYSDYYTARVKSQIDKLKLIVAKNKFKEIYQLVLNIKRILVSKDKCVTHYTSLSTAKELIINGSFFRLSEGTFLNDTSEGKELFNYLSINEDTQDGLNTVASPFFRKPFIGSFVADSKHDDLTLWRMYGKEDKEEGKGCAITFNLIELINTLENKLIIKNEIFTSFKTDEDFSFYRVAYISKGDRKFKIPENEDKEAELNEHMKNLKIKVQSFEKFDHKSDIYKAVIEQLNEIAFLFKNLDYQYEHEIRLVVKGDGIRNVISHGINSSRVYIEIDTINSITEKITLGPKVDNSDEWASTFYYSFKKQCSPLKIPNILISHLPFK